MRCSACGQAVSPQLAQEIQERKEQEALERRRADRWFVAIAGVCALAAVVVTFLMVGSMR